MTTEETLAKAAMVAAWAIMDLFGEEIAKLKGIPYDHQDYAKRLEPLIKKYAEKYLNADGG